MNALNTFAVWFFVLIITPFLAHAQKESPVHNDKENFGIVEGLWFSEEPFFHGETITTYTAIQNNSGATALGVILFAQDEENFSDIKYKIAHKDIVEYSAETNIVYGHHKFTVTIEPHQEYETDSLDDPRRESRSLNSTYSRKIFVDYDTDGDRIGNQVDLDDDADGYSDEEEIQEGTDPLDKHDYPKPPEPEPEAEDEITSEEASRIKGGTRKNIPEVFRERLVKESFTHLSNQLESVRRNYARAVQQEEEKFRNERILVSSYQPLVSTTDESSLVDSETFTELLYPIEIENPSIYTRHATRKKIKPKSSWDRLLSFAWGSVLSAASVITSNNTMLVVTLLFLIWIVYKILRKIFRILSRLFGK